MLEAWNLVRKYTCKWSFRKYTFPYQNLLNFADACIFLQKINIFGKNSTFTQSNSMRAVLEIIYFCFQFLQDKSLLLMKMLSWIYIEKQKKKS